MHPRLSGRGRGQRDRPAAPCRAPPRPAGPRILKKIASPPGPGGRHPGPARRGF